MAKKKKQKEKIVYDFLANVQECNMSEYLQEIVMKYGINVCVFRACPMVMDGLAPGKRRMIYTMYRLGAVYNKPRRKVDDLLGPVQSIHPHGAQSISGTFTNEVKDWETNAGLIDAHGNLGSLTGQRAAATRYLEARLSKYSMKCFFDEFDPDICDMVESNTRITLEPVAIPSKYPNFLLSLTTGIAWGKSISIPPFNLNEVFKLTQALIKNPHMKNVFLYPDSPRGYDIIEDPDIINICETGKGTLKIQARIELDEEMDEKGKNSEKFLEITGFPEMTHMDPIIQKISLMVANKEISGISRISDESDVDVEDSDAGESQDVRFRVYLKKDADPEVIKQLLYKKTLLRSHVNINMNFAARTNMQHLGIKDSLLLWIEYRIDTKQKLYIKKLSKLQEHIHVLDGIIRTLSPENINRVINIIKGAESDEDSIETLMKEFDISSYQAKEINDTKLSKLSRGNRSKFIEDMEKTQKEVKETEEIVTSRDRLKEIIIEELEEGIKLFGRPRSCRVINAGALEPPIHKYNIVVTQKYIKKISVNSHNVGTIDSDDEVIGFFTKVPENRQIFIIDDMGKCYGVKISNLKPNELVAKGTDLKSLVGLKGNPIRAFMHGKDMNADEMDMIMFTNNGLIKRSPLSQYISNRAELQGILLNDNDKVCYARFIDPTIVETGDSYGLIYTSQGFGIAMDLNEVSTTDRLTKGSQYLKLDDKDTVRAVCDMTHQYIFVLTTQGYGKICALDDIFKTSKRRVDMIRLTGLKDGDSVFKIIPVDLDNLDEKITGLMLNGDRFEIKLNEVPVTTRLAKGSKLIPVKHGDAIVKIKEK